MAILGCRFSLPDCVTTGEDMPPGLMHAASNGKDTVVTAHCGCCCIDHLVVWQWDERALCLQPQYTLPSQESGLPQSWFLFSGLSMGQDVLLAFCAGSGLVLVSDPAAAVVHVVDIHRRSHQGFLVLDAGQEGDKQHWCELFLLTTSTVAAVGAACTVRERHCVFLFNTCTMQVFHKIVNDVMRCFGDMVLSRCGTQLSWVNGGTVWVVLDLSSISRVSHCTSRNYRSLMTVWWGAYTHYSGAWCTLSTNDKCLVEFDNMQITMNPLQANECVPNSAVSFLLPMLDDRMLIAVFAHPTSPPYACMAFFSMTDLRTVWISAVARAARRIC